MDKEKQIEVFRVLWEQLMISNKLVVCTDTLKGVGLLDVNILKLLYNSSEIVPKEIVEKLNIPNSTLTNAINRLERKQLVERRLNKNDLRSLQLILTDKGRKAIQEHHDLERELVGEIFTILNEDESKSLVDIFEKISKNL